MPPTVLICLDDSTLSSVVAGRFRQLGWKCLGGDFVSVAIAKQPDLVLLDARADYLLKALKGDSRTNHLSVIAIGGYGDWELRECCLAQGALAFVPRPLEVDAFDALTSFIEHGRTGVSVGTPTSPPQNPAPVARV